MINDKQISKQLSFFQLIKDVKIEIPIIQRDYAQGRVDKIKVRNMFLDALKKALNGSPVELDFIYGSIVNNSLQPLDGQQRLTTLFLLHWYAATKDEILDNEVKELLIKFTYKTRTSSREFCKKLIEKGVDFTETNEEISSLIKNAPWFFLAWEKDPTIKAMLIMIDAIQLKFKDEKNLWSKLINEINRAITFHYIELENFGLSDDLYIKMNARGKQLTSFENFKADFIKHVDLNKWDEDKDVLETFSHKADTTWTDLFWKHRNKNYKIDEAYIKFLSGIAINLYARNLEIYEDAEEEKLVRNELEKKSIKNKITDEAVRNERIERRIIELFNDPNSLDSKDFSTKDGYDYLIKCLDIYSDKSTSRDTLLPTNLILWDYCTDSTLFKEFIKSNETTYKQRALFHAQTEYLLNVKVFDQEAYSNLIRVIRNIVQNSTVDSSSAFRGIINLLNELMPACENIYSLVSNCNIKSKFAEGQVKEEIVKSEIINNINQNVLFKTEDTNFCKGRISFVLYCVDFEKGNIFDHLKLEKIQSVIEKHLSNDDITNEFRRLLFTIEDSKFYNYWSSWVYAIDEPKRCLISDINDLKDYAYGNSRHYLKTLLNQLTEKEISVIINEFIILNDVSIQIPNWKKRLIQEPKLLDDYCQSHYIAVPDNEEYCYLLKVRKPRDKNTCKKIS